MASSSSTQNSNIQISTQDVLTESSNMTSEDSSRNITFPSIPQRAFSRIRATTSSLSSSPTSAVSEYLPTYSIVIADMPPIYPHDDNEPSSRTAGLSRGEASIEQLVHLEAPILPQEYWPITKKLYVYGFIIWPLWLIGTVYIFFGDEYKNHDQEQGTTTNEENTDNNNKFNTGRLKWAHRCLFNLLVIITLITYVAVALNKTKGKLY
jgi:hypothetical protein